LISHQQIFSREMS